MKDNKYDETKKLEREDPEVAAHEEAPALAEEPVAPETTKGEAIKETAEEPPLLDDVYRVVNCAKVNVRRHPRPGIPADVIGSLPKDEIVHVDSKFVNPDFKKVVKDGALVGYVSAAYLEKI